MHTEDDAHYVQHEDCADSAQEPNKVTQEFIVRHLHKPVHEIALHAKAQTGVDLHYALQHIDAWQRAQHKLPQWAATSGVMFPPKISMEQCSSQYTARYKADIVSKWQQLQVHAQYADTADMNTDIDIDIDIDTDPDTNTDSLLNAPHHELLDLTGGFGVDTTMLAPLFEAVTMVEQQSELAGIAAHNMMQFGLHQVQVYHASAEHIIAMYKDSQRQVSWIMVDPARRDIAGRRTYAIEDCMPNVCALMPQMLALAPMILIKLSPMLDWHKAVADIEAAGAAVQEVHIVAVANECKELLLVAMRPELQRQLFTQQSAIQYDAEQYCIEQQHVAQQHVAHKTLHMSLQPMLHIVQLHHKGTQYDSHITIALDTCNNASRSREGASYAGQSALSEAARLDFRRQLHDWLAQPVDAQLANYHTAVQDAECQQYDQYRHENSPMPLRLWVYEPHAAMMKSGCFHYLSEHYPVMQLADNSHVFIAQQLCIGFPGKAYRVQAVSTTNKKQVTALLADLTQANIAVRNFPKSVATLRKQWKLRDGGDTTLIATTADDGTHLIVRCVPVHHTERALNHDPATDAVYSTAQQ